MIESAGSMQQSIAIIATNGKRKYCDFSSIHSLRIAQQKLMETIDAKWIELRLKNERGEKAALARAIGVEPHIISKILAGTRQVRSDEAPRVVAFFTKRDGESDGPKQRLVGVVDRLTEEEARILLATANAVISQRLEEEK